MNTQLILKNSFLSLIFIFTSWFIQPGDDRLQSNNSIQPVQISAVKILSEQDVLSCLQKGFKDVGICPTVNLKITSRLIASQKYTHTKLQVALQSMQDMAKKQKSKVVTRHHISAVIFDHADAVASAVYFKMFSKYSTAIHEAGHAVALVYLLQDHCVLYEISIGLSKNNEQDAIGRVTPLSIDGTVTAGLIVDYLIRWNKFIDFHHKIIMMNLAGGIAEQVFGVSKHTGLYDCLDVLNWFTQKPQSIGFDDFLAQSGCATDIELAYEQAEFLIDRKFVKKTKEEVIKELYFETYRFVLEHKDQVRKLADYIMKHDQDVFFYDEVYNLLGLERPLFDFEKLVIRKELKKTKKPSWFRSWFFRGKS